ncbi:DEAD/DEAH box helicase [Brevundimonas sp. NPDC046655]|uniref:DEAD/DEAH box helicase n=1 Tax=unclassified Brevundimonas TaxID=2622653 RepID=UPI00384C3A2C
MFDADSARLIRMAPAIGDNNPQTLPQDLTRAYAQLVALRLRTDEPDAEAQAELRHDRLMKMAAVYEGLVDTLADKNHRRGAAFVAATAYQILGRVAGPDAVDLPVLSPDAIHPQVAAPLLFMIAGQAPDAREAGTRLIAPRDASVLVRALVESVIDLARENLDGILSRAARLAESRPSARAGVVDQVEQTLYGLCWAGLVQLAAAVLDRETPRSVFRLGDTPAETFRRVETLAASDPDGDGGPGVSVNAYAGPRHLARLLRHAAGEFMGHGLAGLAAPAGADEAVWRPWLYRRALDKPMIWPNHRQAIAKGVLEPGRSAVLVLPTGAGKTTLSELKIAATIASGKTVIFLAPTLALVDQLKDDFSKSFKDGMGDIVVSADGDLSLIANGPSLSAIEVMTPERLLAMLSFADADLSDVGLVVFDECHLLAPQGGGSRSLDAMLCLLHAARRAPDADFLFLSAMLTNGEEFARWIADLTGRPTEFFHDPWKPSRQARGVVIYPQDELDAVRAAVLAGSKDRTFPASPNALFGLQQNWVAGAGADTAVVRLTDRTVPLTANAWQATPNANAVAGVLAERAARAGLKTIIFVQQADYAPSTARTISERYVGPWKLTPLEQGLIADIAVELGTGDSLVNAQAGAVPHNGDMIPLERRLAESLFRRPDGPSIIVATPTLAQGINLPAQVALLAGDKRVQINGGREPLEQHELLNAAGRAGRAGFLANGTVLLVPEPVIGFTPGVAAIGAYGKLRSILPLDDRCVVMEDPVEAVLDRIQNGVRGAEIDYFVNRMRFGEPGEADAAAVALAGRSFGAWQARARGETIDAAVTALEAVLADTPAEDDATGARVAALTGLPRASVAALAARLGDDPAAFPQTIPAWVAWIVAFFRAEPALAGEMVGDLETIKSVVRGRKTGPAITDDEWARLDAALLAWIGGQTFSDIELALGVVPDRVRACGRARDLVLKVINRNLYMVATAAAELAKRRLPPGADGATPNVPAVLEILPYALRSGYDTPAAAAFHHLQTDIRTRVGAHQAFGADPVLAALSNEGTYRQVYDRVETHLILQEMETLDE